MQTTTKNVKRACPHTPGVRLRVLPTSGLLLLSLLLLLPTAAWGQFEFVTNNGAITITAYTGPGGQVAIPGSINDLPVTTIGDYAFAGADIITGVTIPNSVTSIGEGSFSDCIYLTCVTIPNSVISIGYGAFYDCLSLATVTNGAGVATVGGLAFAWDFSLTGVYFLGNAPSLGGPDVFDGSDSATVYYLFGTTGWGSTFGGRPAVLLNPPPPPAIATASPLVSGTVGSAYSLVLSNTDGIPPCVWSIVSGSLPAGLALAATNGTIVGTPASPGTAFFRARVTDAQSRYSDKDFILTVYAANSQPAALSILTYNVSGNGAADWSTNASQVRAIGRQVAYLQPDVVTFNEIPVPYCYQMTNFVKAYLPGYYLATNSQGDGYIMSVIASRHPITRSTSWLSGSSLVPFGDTHSFLRDLFEAEISIPNFPQPLHVFTTHLKAYGDSASALWRSAQAGAISNYFVTGFLTTNASHPYILTGDLNEDITQPDSANPPIQRLASAATGLQLTTPVNPTNGSPFTESIRTTLNIRFDYILPGRLMFSNIVSSQVFRTDLLSSPPPPLLADDDVTASDHLPVMMTFSCPCPAPTITCTSTNKTVELGAAWTFDTPTATDSCGTVTVSVLGTVTNTSGHCGTTFDATRTWAAVNGCGNSASCSQKVTVVDTTAPVIACVNTNRTVELGQAWTFDAPTATDNSGTATISVLSTVTNASGHCGTTFDATRTWVATDGCGNSASCSQKVTVADTTAPVIACVDNKTVELGQAWTFDAPTATDNNGTATISVLSTVTNTAGQSGNGFVAVRTWVATDGCGNSAPCGQTVTVNDNSAPVPFTYTTNNGAITITGYTGPGGVVSIPGTINGLPVTAIGANAFQNNSSLTSVTIPDSVTSIGIVAFQHCSGLTNVTLGNGVTSVGGWAFYSCSSLAAIAIPNSVTSIGDYAFSSCTGLTSVTIPNSITYIGTGPFSWCTSVTVITVDPLNSAYSSVDGVLFNKSLTTLVQCPGGKSGTYAIPNSVATIGGAAFSGCTSLTNVTIGNSVTSIADYAFEDCTSLTSVTIPDGVAGIGYGAFQSCIGLTSVTIGNSVTSIGDAAFGSCYNLTNVTIGNSVTSIGGAFFHCHSLTSVTIPNSVTNIVDGAFEYCMSLRGVYFQGNAPTLGGSYVFYGDNDATVYYLPGTSGWGSTFGGRPAVMLNPPSPAGSLQVTITPAGAITAGAEWQVDGGIPQPSGVTVLGLAVGDHTVSFSTVSGWTTPPNQTIPVTANSTATAAGTYVLQAPPPFTYTTNNGTITITGYTGPGGAVSIPSTINGLPVTAIGANAFQNSSSLTSVTIPDTLTNVGSYAFSSCISLTNVTIGNSVTSIADYAFYYCFSLTSVTIPNSVASIGYGAFSACASLTAITVDAVNSHYTSVGGVLFNKSQTALIAYPGGNWGSYTVPNSVTSIGDGAFSECMGLTSITIPNSVTSIGDGAFVYCSLTSVTIPDGVTSIGDGAFADCYSLTSVSIGNSVTSIGEWAFVDCGSLTSVTIGNSVAGIGDGAFSYCTSLTGMYFRGNAPTLGGSSVFYGDNNATVYYLPGTSGWDSTFGGLPTAPWLLPSPAILDFGSSFGVKTNRFGFIISWATNASVAIVAHSNLTDSNWTPICTNTLSGGWSYFSDPGWTNHPSRFYRLRWP